MDEED